MNCACRTAALGIFVRNVAHVQLPSASAASRFSHSTPLASSLQRLRVCDAAPNALLGAASSRSFHATSAKSDEAESAGTASKTDDGPIGSKHSEQGTPKRRARAKDTDSFKKASKPKKRKPDWPKAETASTANEIRKPSLHERILEENAELEDLVQKRTNWKEQKAALKKKFPEGWKPLKKLSPDAIAGIRALHQQYPDEYTTPVLAEKFKVSPEAIRRILKSKWTPNPDEEIERQERWFERGKKVWAKWAEEGVKPPKRWRNEGIVRDPIWNMTQKDKEELKALKKEKRRVFRFQRKIHIEGFDDRGLAAPFPWQTEKEGAIAPSPKDEKPSF